MIDYYAMPARDQFRCDVSKRWKIVTQMVGREQMRNLGSTEIGDVVWNAGEESGRKLRSEASPQARVSETRLVLSTYHLNAAAKQRVIPDSKKQRCNRPPA